MMNAAVAGGREGGRRQKDKQTKKKEENRQIGAAVWRGIIENASLSFIQTPCQPSQPDLKGV